MTATLVGAEYGPAFAELRAERKARVLAAMERDGVDALILGRSGNGKYVAGHRDLWRAVLGGFGPMVVLVRSTGGIHLAASTWDDGIPAEIPHENLTGLTWNPREAVSGLVRAEGLSDCNRIAADGMSPGIAGLLDMLAPGVELVDGEALMREVRRVKTPAEIEVMRTGIGIAEGCLAAAVERIAPGVSEREVQAAFMDAMASSYAVTIPAFAGIFRVAGDLPPLPGASGRVVSDGDSFVISAAVMYAGYEAAVVRTWVPGQPAEEPAALTELVAACRPGCLPSQLAAFAGDQPQPGPVVVGLGMGVEPPVAGGPADLTGFANEPLEAGMVLGLQLWSGGVLSGCMVQVRDGEPVRLTPPRTAP
ncbi:MAG TPA: M24 family metallopeptidase [Mycobacteriales bacterium]|nr:M24 family metallopeptidase [Mycobacteriales bacterium]